jgi:BspA type Leucine rich repeat region (6 copies)
VKSSIKLIPLLLAALLCAPLIAQAQYTFTTNTDGTLNISKFTGGGGAVTIPDTYSNVPITSVGYEAFDLSGISSVTMGSNLTSIGIYGFSDCYGLKSITFGPNLTSIANSAFSGCSVLKNVTIPDSVTNFGVDVFFDCYKLTNANLGNGVPSLPNYTFNNCTSLVSVVFGRSVASIGNAVFTYCPLQAITVDPLSPYYRSVDGVLYDKNQTKLILYPYGKGGTSYTIPDSVIVIGNDAFYNCTGFTNIVIPNHVTDIQGSAFLACSGLAGVTIGSSVTNIEQAAFEACALTNVVIPDSVTSIGQYAFYNCTSLTNVVIGKGITTIVGGAFLSCPNLLGVYFEGNAPSSSESFSQDGNATAYYLPGTLGWSPRFGDPYGLPTAPWYLPNPAVLTFEPNFGIRTNRFGFTISWATNSSVVVEACTNLAHPVWSPVATNALASGSIYFNDPQWTNYPGRFYRVRSQ